VAGTTPALAKADFSGVATLTSEYIYRGIASTNGDPALQLGLSYEHRTGLFAGLWGSTLDLTSPVGTRDAELDWYLGFHYAGDSSWSATVTALRYTYPGATGTHAYDYNEVRVGAGFGDHYSIEFAYTNDLFGLDRVGKHWEMRGEWPVAGIWDVSIGLGGNDMSDLGTPHYLHWDAGVSARANRFTADLRWFGNQQIDGRFFGPLSAGSQLVLSLSVGF